MRKNLVAMACCSLAVSTPVSAATVFDPVGDFLPSYTGPQIGELDVTSFSVVFDPASSIFTIGGTLAGAIDPATGAFTPSAWIPVQVPSRRSAPSASRT